MQTARNQPGHLHLLRLKDGSPWLHMCIRHRETAAYLMDEAELDDLIVDALLEEDTRSRVRLRDDGIMVLLKAMHLKGEEMAKPEDMVSIRLWLTPGNVITTREADVDPVIEIASRLIAGEGPETPGAFLADLVEEHLREIAEQVEMLEDATDEIARLINLHQSEQACPNMADTETRISGFLRHLNPQRPVLETLSTHPHPVIGDRERAQLDDALNRLLRFLETLQNLRERIAILNDQVERIQDRHLSRSSYVFAAVATIFLPLGFVSGMFGVNLPGIPLETMASGFWALFAICVGLVAVVIGLLRWNKML